MVDEQSDLGIVACRVGFLDEPDFHAVEHQSDHGIVAYGVEFDDEPDWHATAKQSNCRPCTK